jgi:putative Mg2+ transporter-C (MgtC) family protein
MHPELGAMSLSVIFTRLFVAALIGCVIGLNRFAHHRYIGVRTLGLVALGAAGLVVAAFETGTGSDQLAAASRIIQGIVTGIGFLGAGVIVHRERGHKVHGLTTAATVWVAAAAGILCGLGAWRVAIIVTLLVGLVLLVGGPIEKLLIDYSGSAEEGSKSLPDKEPPSAF